MKKVYDALLSNPFFCCGYYFRIAIRRENSGLSFGIRCIGPPNFGAGSEDWDTLPAAAVAERNHFVEFETCKMHCVGHAEAIRNRPLVSHLLHAQGLLFVADYRELGLGAESIPSEVLSKKGHLKDGKLHLQLEFGIASGILRA